MRTGFFRRVAATVVAIVVVATPVPVSAAEPSDPASTEVTFMVRNVNRSKLPCLADGKSYALRGTLVGPADKINSGRVDLATVYVHDFTTGSWFWRLPEANYVEELAREGQVSLVFDRLGYSPSPAPHGQKTCLGAQADMVHQVVQQLRAGSYGSAGARPASGKVVLAGHSVGAGIAELEAASFRDVDGLTLMSWADSGPSVRAISEAALQTTQCLRGGDPKAPQDGFAYFGQTDAAFKAVLFRTASAAVQAAAVARRSADPCGDVLLLAPMIALNNILTHTIDIPVLLLFGEKDALNRPDSVLLQPLGYAPNADVTTRKLPGTGSALPLEASAPQTRQLFTTWVCDTYGCG